MWIEELLEHDRPIHISIHFWDIRKEDTSGTIRPSASTAGINWYFVKILVCGVFGTPNHIFDIFYWFAEQDNIYLHF